jgi:hypothetical protein
MDLVELIQELRDRKRRVERTIAALETIWGAGSSHDAGSPQKGVRSSGRGRKSMPARERAEVSQRMKLYWAEWRRKRKLPPPAAPTD